MRKLLKVMAIFIFAITSGCSVYHAPWDNSKDVYKKAPVYKETKVYQKGPYDVKAPVLINENKEVSKPVKTKPAKVLKEKVINVNAVSNTVPNVSSSVVKKGPIKKEVLIIPIE